MKELTYFHITMVQMAETTRGMALRLGTFLGGAGRGKSRRTWGQSSQTLRSGPRISHSILADMLTVCLQKMFKVCCDTSSKGKFL